MQGVGTLYALGTRAVADLVVAHTAESLSPTDLRLFLRLFFRSGLAARADLALVFPSGAASRFNRLIVRERDSFVELLSRYRSDGNLTTLPTGFDPTHFAKSGKKGTDSGEPIWGRRNRGNSSESDGLSYGSVVGFDADELDPENALSGFLDHVPMGLRRWACYPMLLGRVWRNFKNVMLVDIKDVLLLGDPLGRVKNHSPESVFLKGPAAQSSSGKHGRRNSEKSEWTRKNSVDPGVVMGGLKGVRRFSNAMLTDIVRFSIQHRKKKNSVTESSIFNHLVGNEHVLKDVNLVVSAESLPEVSSLALSGSKPGSHLFSKNYGVIRRGPRGNSNLDLINSMVMKHICSFPIDSTVYIDC
ncbi:tRNA 2-selenouridine synthase [Striga asiatica]|uniref:tRNA 2-selenouridine synthase n=1 Tax=Striga asiatica TaxID=4170 RepID=A0A5A7R3J6_STRAF|nr:tRNA 2-selenouridine synthase [Striga asiatica]